MRSRRAPYEQFANRAVSAVYTVILWKAGYRDWQRSGLKSVLANAASIRQLVTALLQR